MNREVNVTKRVKTLQGLRYCPVVLSANGRIRPDWVLVNGREERHPEGAYYLEWREGAKRTRLSVGNDPATATARQMQKEAELNAKNHGIEMVPAVPQNGNNGHRSLATAVAEFLEETKLTKKPKTLAAYTTSLDYFAESCPKQYLEDIERRDLLKFAAFLRDEKEQAPRSCSISIFIFPSSAVWEPAQDLLANVSYVLVGGFRSMFFAPRTLATFLVLTLTRDFGPYSLFNAEDGFCCKHDTCAPKILEKTS